VTSEGRHHAYRLALLSTMCAGLSGFGLPPVILTERLIRACAELPKVCEHYSFQSGDNEVLKRMARLHSRKYRRIIHTIRQYMPDASISADAIGLSW